MKTFKAQAIDMAAEMRQGERRGIYVVWLEETEVKKNKVCVCVIYWHMYVGQWQQSKEGGSMNGDAEKSSAALKQPLMSTSGFLFHPQLHSSEFIMGCAAG